MSPNPDTLRDRALALLARREHAVQELTQKLVNRGFEPEAVSSVVQSLADDGLLSESRYIDALIRWRIAQGHGPLRIESDARRWGISGNNLANSEEWQECDWEGLVCQVWSKRFQDLPQDPVEYQRQYRYLHQRGFTDTLITKALG